MRTKFKLSALLVTGALALATGPAMAGDVATELSNTCAGCHGTNGYSAGETMPSIAGLPQGYLRRVLMEYREGTRQSTIMGRIMRGYDDAQVHAIADWFAAKPWKAAASHASEAQVHKGKSLIATCGACHVDDGRTGNDAMPPLAGQVEDYLAVVLHASQDPDRTPPSQRACD